MTSLEEKMVKIYASLVVKGEKSIDNVPENIREEVRKAVELWEK